MRQENLPMAPSSLKQQRRSDMTQAMTPMESVGRLLWLKFWWASPRASFTEPGLYVWLPIVKKNVRLIKAA